MQDDSGRTETVLDEYGQGTRSVYDGGGRLERSERLDATGRVIGASHFTYDALGRKIAEVSARGIKTNYYYDTLGHNTETIVTTPDGVEMVTRTGYDNAGRQAWTWQAGETGPGSYTRFIYDPFGRPEYTYYACPDLNSFGDSFTRVQYNEQGLRWKETYEEGSVTEYHYDSKGTVLLLFSGS